MTIKVQDERKGNTNYVNSNILECVKFWNREGEDVYVKNRFGKLGSKETNEMAVERSAIASSLVIQILSLSQVEQGVMFGYMRTMIES
jgi:hypothetical protein